jgi:hypothetical protein
MQIKGESWTAPENVRLRVLDFGIREPVGTGRAVEMLQGMDDFTIVLSELTDMATFGLPTYKRLNRLWRMVERYKMTAPLAITVIDSKARRVRAFRGDQHPTTGWQLEDEMPPVKPLLGHEVEFPLTIKAQDAKGNILKMRVQLAVSN